MAYVPYDQYDIPQDEWNRIKEEWRKLEFQYQGKERGGLPLHPNDIVMPEELKPLFKQFSYVRQGYDIPDYSKPFYIENADTVTGSISFQNMKNKKIEYSFDEVNWITISIPSASAVTISNITPGTKVYLRGTNSAVGSGAGKHISADFNHNLGGNICSLLDKTNFSTMTSITSTYAFGRFFYQDTKLISAAFNFGNVTSLGNYVLQEVFIECTSLTTLPDFSNVTTLGNSALAYAFQGCTSLTTPPDLRNVISLGADSLQNAFQRCTSLTTPPDLSNVTTLGNNALAYAFRTCTSLTSGPDLSNVTSLGTYVFNTAFRDCSKLQTIYVPNVNTWSTTIFNDWVNGAGTSAAEPKQMIFQTQALLNACPSGTSGYGSYTKVLAS